MTTRSARAVALVSALTIALWTAVSVAGSPDHDHAHGHDGNAGHMHVQVPPAYAATRMPVGVSTDPHMLERGKAIFLARCAMCHGERGDGHGPAAGGLGLKPPDLTDGSMVAMMPESYWFWRVSEGGQVEPFRSQGSAMPAWKSELSVAERWAVIAYAETLSGHPGPPMSGMGSEHGMAEGGHGHAEHGPGH